MQTHFTLDDTESEFRTKATYLISLAGVIFLTPLTFNHLIQGQYLTGLCTLAVLMLVAANSWEAHRGYSRSWLVIFLLAPCLIALLFVGLNQGSLATYGIFPVTIAWYCLLDIRRALVLNVITLIVLLPCVWFYLELTHAVWVIASVLAVSVFAAIGAITAYQFQHALVSRAAIDPLTGLLNRAQLGVTLQAAVEKFRRQQTPVTLLMFDVDILKAISDSDGYSASDQVLVAASEVIQQSIRASDVCFRLGGEELLCVLFGANYTNAMLVANRIRAHLDATHLAAAAQATMSIGVSTLQHGETWQDWLARVDEQLYEAKRIGQNHIA